jgi:putative phage-type endonuclease
MTTEERAAWLQARKLGLGGSDAAVALGFSEYKTPYQLWAEKRGEVEPDDLSGNPHVEWGNRLESVVAEKYADETGREIACVDEMLVHPDHPWMLANLDRRIVGESRGLEIKTSSALVNGRDAWGPAFSDQVPEAYLLQVHHYLTVTQYDVFDLAVLFLKDLDFRIYEIRRNPHFSAQLIEGERAFWHGVVNGIPPNAQTIADTRRKFPSHVAKTTIEADEYTRELLEEYLSLDEQIKAMREVEERKENLAARIGDFMGTNEVLTVNGVDRLSFKGQSTGKRLPSSFKDAEPDMFAKYAVEGHTRVMRILKEKKS